MAEATKEAAKPVAKKVVKKAKEVVESDIQPIEVFADGADTVADSLHGVAEFSRGLTQRQLLLASGAVVVGVAVGGFVGYRLAEKKLSTKFEELMDEETERLKEHYDAKAEALKAQDKPDLVDRAAMHRQADQAEAIITEQGYSDPPITFVEATPEGIAAVVREQEAIREANETAEEPMIVTNAFQKRDEEHAGEWDYSAEMKTRDPQKPYIVHVDEFMENISEYDKEDLTFYEGDGVLANERDQPISDSHEAVGNENLSRFGHGSGDPNVVFVRNDVREILYEISRSYGSFAMEVHGIMPEPSDLQHSDERHRRRKFDDD